MAALHQTKCINHESREAAARCPMCRNFFCRECITEHDGRVVCASCLQRAVEAAEAKITEKSAGKVVAGATGVFKVVASLLVLWMLFYALGQFLLLFPDSFHSGDMWTEL